MEAPSPGEERRWRRGGGRADGHRRLPRVRPLLRALLLYGEAAAVAAQGLAAAAAAALPKVKAIALPSPDFLVVRPGANADPAAETARVTLSGPLSPPRDLDLCLGTGEWLLSSAPSPPPPAPGGGGDGSDCGLEVASERSPTEESPSPSSDDARSGATKEEEEQEQAPRPVLLALYGCYGLPLDPGFDPCRPRAREIPKGRLRPRLRPFARRRGAREEVARGGEGREQGARRRGREGGRHVAELRERERERKRERRERGRREWKRRRRGTRRREELGRRPVALVAESAGALAAGALLADPGVAPPALCRLAASAVRGRPRGDCRRGRRREKKTAGEEKNGGAAPAVSRTSAASFPLFLLSGRRRLGPRRSVPLPLALRV